MIMGVVADDITGSNDIGSMFAKAGLRVHVYRYDAPGALARSWPAETALQPDICILDTNSRLDPPSLAYDKVRAATGELQQFGCRQFHNKTCSVFRGNIGPEFDAMLDALGQDFAVVVLGFPKNGRLTLDGIHYVHGQRLEDSEFRHDPIHPMRRSDLVGILQAQTRRRVGLVTQAVVAQGAAAVRAEVLAQRGRFEYVIVDVPSQAGLRTIAQAVHDLPVLCGSSAIAEELPAAWGVTGRPERALDLPAHAGLGVLCVAGSLMPQTRAQLAHLRSLHLAAVRLDTVCLPQPEARAREIERAAAEAAELLLAGRDVAVHSPTDPAVVEQTRAAGTRAGLTATEVARLVTESLAEVVARIAMHVDLRRLIVAGGETSAAVCARLGISALEIWREIQPGLPSCLSLTQPPRLLVLKSGSFGSPDFLAQAIQHVKTQ